MKAIFRKYTKTLLAFLFIAVFAVTGFFIPSRSKAALGECEICLTIELGKYHAWMIKTFFIDNVLRALMMFTENVETIGQHEMMIFGTFLDAKHQMDTQLLFQNLQFEAHKDYQPSEDFCWFGTNMRSLAPSDQRSRYNKAALASRQMARHLGNVNVPGSLTRDQDKQARWDRFVNRYCDPRDNDWRAGKADSGLVAACAKGGGGTKLINLDIDYTRLIEEPRTLNAAFYHPALSESPREDPSQPAKPEELIPNEQDIITMGNNLYGHNTLARVRGKGNVNSYLDLRSIAAKRSVAENSFNSIVALKTAGSSDDPRTPSVEQGKNGKMEDKYPQTRAFLAAVMIDLGIPEDEVFGLIGQRPSYYAQLEILAKKIYQNPSFYANLYDTPANVARKSAAMKAIDLMLDREMYESQLRREMTLSVLLSSRLRQRFRDINSGLESGD